MRLYNDFEIECLAELDALIDDLSVAAKEAIEKAAAESAKAAALASVEREAALLQEKMAAAREAQRWRNEAETAKKDQRKAGLFGLIVGLLGGLTIGVSGALFIGGR